MKDNKVIQDGKQIKLVRADAPPQVLRIKKTRLVRSKPPRLSF